MQDWMGSYRAPNKDEYEKIGMGSYRAPNKDEYERIGMGSYSAPQQGRVWEDWDWTKSDSMIIVL